MRNICKRDSQGSSREMSRTFILCCAAWLIAVPGAVDRAGVSPAEGLAPSYAIAAGAHVPEAQVHEVTIHGFKFEPQALTVHVGDTIVWKNEDIVAHTVTAVDKSFDSGKIAPGSSWKLVVKRTGSFPYTCTPHPNMRGKIIVQ